MTPFAPLFVPEAFRDAVSSEAWLAALLETERALATAGATAGLVPPEAATAIRRATVPEGLQWHELLQEGHSAGTPVEPLVRALQARVDDEHAQWVHFGATSQDIMDTAAALVTRRALGLILDELARVAVRCASLAREHRSAPMAGRTLLQQAVPTTFGLKAAGWLVAVLDARRRLVELRGGLAAQLGGAAGTLSALGDQGVEVAALFARAVGLADPVLPWHANRVRSAELGSGLEVAAGVLAKLALDLELLAQTEVAEVAGAPGRGVSSTMPHKRNLAGAVRARACYELARGHASVLRAALLAEHERAAGSWQAEWDALSGALATTGAAGDAVAEELESVEIDAGRMRHNLAATNGGVASERAARRLAERLGSTAARELVRDASAAVAVSGRPLAEELASRDTGLTRMELDVALDPLTYLGSAEALVDRALARYDAGETER